MEVFVEVGRTEFLAPVEPGGVEKEALDEGGKYGDPPVRPCQGSGSHFR